jgi:DNA-binding winged helix-turn-helix (wHTH) protein/TolB-like protein
VLHFCADGCLLFFLMPPAQSKRSYRFGLFEADLASGELLRQGVRVRLQDQPFRVLIVLLEFAGEVVSREELRRKLWPVDTYVEFDGSLNAALTRLRSALGDSADNPIFIETVPRRGYRFIAPVTFDHDSEVAEAAEEFLPLLTSSGLPGRGDDFALTTRWRGLWWTLAVLLVLLSLVGWRYTRTSPLSPPAPAKVVAVLPFANEGAGPDFDYLRYAIANDLVTDLTDARSVTVRPFASTSRYGSQSADPATVGKELRVNYVVAGGFLLDKQNLRVDLELVDVARNQPLWRNEVSVSPQELVALHDQLAVRATHGLLPAMNLPRASANEIPAPKNEQALDLFLHSLTIPLDPEPNQLAIKKLEESVSLDNRYAPAWGELGWRYYIDYHYGKGGEAAVAKALQAYQRQSELDPDVPLISTTIRVEQGDLNGAYDQAAEYLRKHPNGSMAHYSMGYVLRYAGLLEEAGRQCDAALTIDPGFNLFRSCATPFLLRGDYPHARQFMSLDEHSGIGALFRLLMGLRTGNIDAASRELDAVSKAGYTFTELLRLYLNHAGEKDLSRAADAVEADPKSSRDAEELYRNAEILSFSQQNDAAIRQLRKAIQGNYCSYPAMETDPLMDGIRHFPGFAELQMEAIQCQQSFLAHRQRVDAALTTAR